MYKDLDTQRVAKRRYYAAHKEQMRAKQNAYYAAHKEERRERTRTVQKIYASVHKERIAENKHILGIKKNEK